MTAPLKVILGLGCDRGVSLETLQTAVEQALDKVDLSHNSVKSLASIDKKNDEKALLALSKQYRWPMKFFSAAQLACIEVPNPSEVVLKYMGTPAVAEAAALLAVSLASTLVVKTDMNNLIVEKHKYCGADGKNATVSIARLSDE
jgi:cobalt-precorrin 5A hydrolase